MGHTINDRRSDDRRSARDRSDGFVGAHCRDACHLDSSRDRLTRRTKRAISSRLRRRGDCGDIRVTEPISDQCRMDSARFEQVRPQLPLQARTPAHVMPIVVSDSFARTFFRGVDAVGAYPFRQRRPGADRRRCHRHVEPAADRPDEAMMYQPIYSGAGFIVYSRELLGCFGARDRGTCTNTLRISRLDVEARVLDALQTKLLRKDFFEEFCREFAKEMNRLRMEQRAGQSSAKRELVRLEAKRKKLVESIMEGCQAARSRTR